MQKWNIFFLGSLIVMPITLITAHQKAVVVVPVADLVGDPLMHQGPALNAYHQLPICGGKQYAQSCKRIHQLLFNEMVDIIKQEGEQCLVAIPHIYFITASCSIPQAQFWTLKSNIMRSKDLISIGIDIRTIPPPLIRTQPTTMQNSSVVTLIQPWHDHLTNRTFSAGTRFVRTPDTSSDVYQVSIFDPATKKTYIAAIPKTVCMMQNSPPSAHRQQFIALVRSWAHQPHGCIPYVWAGSSFTHTSLSHTFDEIETDNGQSYFILKNYSPLPKTGFDCSGLVHRAAQLVGIPYFCKNTFTIEHTLHRLQPGQQLREGDLIVIKGHVMIVSDIANNLLVEARSYHHGYGKVHEIELGKVFKGINTYADLAAAYSSQTPLYRIDSSGKVRDAFTTFALIQLPA